MKKFLWIITLFMLCGVCVFGFAACEEDNGENITTPDTPAHTHMYTETVVPPTCTEKGYTLYKCSCGNEYQNNYTNALGHNFVDEICARCGQYEHFIFYLLKDETYEVVSRTLKLPNEIILPPVYNNKSVTSIGDYAFNGCSNVTSITIPDSVTSIGSYAFSNCSSLTSIVIPDSVTSIGRHAFEFCPCVNTYQDMCYVDKWLVIGDYFITNANIKDGIVGIADYAFSPSNLTSITIPDSLINIGYQAFYDCKSLTNVTFGENSQLKSIGEVAFADCDSLTSITIPDSVTSIGSGAFCVCSSLTSINVDENNENYKSIDGNLYSKGGEHIIQYAIGKTTTEFTIPDRVISIGNFAFCECSSLTSVIIPDSVTGIGEYAFDDCDNLTSVYYNGAVEDWLNISIGLGNTYLTNATLYYYSETEPIEDGNYWHYDSDGITPVIWVKEN